MAIVLAILSLLTITAVWIRRVYRQMDKLTRYVEALSGESKSATLAEEKEVCHDKCR